MQPIHMGNTHIYDKRAILYVEIPNGNVHRAHQLPSWCATGEELIQLWNALPLRSFDWGTISLAINAFAVEEAITHDEEDRITIVFWTGEKLEVQRTYEDPTAVLDATLANARTTEAQGD